MHFECKDITSLGIIFVDKILSYLNKRPSFKMHLTLQWDQKMKWNKRLHTNCIDPFSIQPKKSVCFVTQHVTKGNDFFGLKNVEKRVDPRI